MNRLGVIGRFFFAISMAAFGIQHLVYLEFVTRVAPRLPAWVPGPALLAGVFGMFLVAAGAAMMIEKAARSTALLLGTVILASFALLYLPLLITNPPNGGLWTSAGKALALSGGGFLVAGSLYATPASPVNALAIAAEALEHLIPLGRYFLSLFLILCGIEHFIYVEFVAGLIPYWIPGHLCWTYISGVALIAGGIGICIRLTSRPAAVLTGMMIFLWVVLLHIPRATANLRDANETTAVFEALAISGTAFLAATASQSKK